MNKLNYVDLIILIILLLDFFSGIKIGAISFLFDIVSFVAGWFIAKTFFLKFASFLTEKSNILQWISKTISPLIKVPESISNLAASLQNIETALNNISFPSFIKDFITKNFSTNSQTVSQFIINRLSIWIVNGISFIILFLATMILLRIIGLVIKKILRFNPFLKWVDVLFGGILKVAVSAIIIFIVLEIVINIFGFLNVQNNSIIYQIKYSWFYLNIGKIFPSIKNLILKVFS
jgi:uncharacterized membrane protein required for colicin V production